MNQHKTLLGIDVGGTKIHAALYYADDFTMLQEKRIATPVDVGFDEILYQITQLVQDLRGRDTVAVGVGFPGYINHKTGMLYKTPNLPLKASMNVLEYLREAIDLPVAVDNDAKLFALAEYENNWKHQVQNLIGLNIGTGLGAGFILNGELYRGRDGFAGEIGHTAFDMNHEFEDFVSGKNHKADFAMYLGVLLSNVITLFNPEVIVLGGSGAKDFNKIQKQVWQEIKRRTIIQSQQSLRIEISQLLNASTLGAAMMAGRYAL